MEKMTVRPLIFAGFLLLVMGIVGGIVTHPYGFPWGPVFAISAGTWCLLTAIKSWVERKAVLLERATDLCSLYNTVERNLSHALQPETTHETIIHLVQDARNNLRTIMRKMGWKGPF